MAQYEKRKKAVSTLKEIDTRPDNYIIVHYTCDNFKVSQIISSIAVRQLADGQTESFSLYKAAQEMNIENDASPNNKKKNEKKMLSNYYKFVNKNLEKKWIHWGMNSDNYGFKAIEHRYRVLGGRPKYIADDKKINLASLFIDAYGKGYAKHPRMESLITKNKISSPNDFLPGYNNNPDTLDEVKALHQRQYKLIQMSCLRKVDIFENFINLAINKQLKTYTPWIKIYGLSIKGILASLNEQWWFKALTYIVVAVAGYFFNNYMHSIFK